MEGGEWKLKDPIVAPLSARLRCLYPSKGLQRLEQEFLYDFSEQQEALYYTDSVTPQSTVYAVSFVPLLPKQRVTLDMSALPSDALLEELSLKLVYPYGTFRLSDATFYRNTDYRYPGKLIKRIGKPNPGVYSQDVFVFPGEENEPLWGTVTIAGKVYELTPAGNKVEERKWQAGGVYEQRFVIPNRYRLAKLPQKEQGNFGKVVPLKYPVREESDLYDVTVTDYLWRTAYNNEGYIFRLWVDNYSDEEKELEMMVRVLTLTGQVVCQSPVYKGCKVKPWHYDGFTLPLFITVPQPGRYRYQLLVRTPQEEEWHEPIPTVEDTPASKEFEVKPSVGVFVAGVRTLDNKGWMHRGSIYRALPNEQNTFRLHLNSYLATEQKATLRLRYRRDPIADGHTNYTDDLRSWDDVIATTPITLPAQRTTLVEVPFAIPKAYPTIQRYQPNLYATIDFGDGEEHILNEDANLALQALGKVTLYRADPNSAHQQRSVSQIISGLSLNNKGNVLTY